MLKLTSRLKVSCIHIEKGNNQTKQNEIKKASENLFTSAALELGRKSNSNFVPETGEESGGRSSNMGNLKCGDRIGREGIQLHLNQWSEPKH